MNRLCRLPRLLLSLLAASLLTTACSGPKEAVADAQLQRGEYFQAAQTYRKLYNSLKKPKDRHQRGMIARKLAECEAKLGRNARAAAAYRNAIRYTANDSLNLPWARALHADGKYKEALAAYDIYLAAVDSADFIARAGKSGAEMAAKSHASRYKVAPARFLNSRRSEFSPVLADQGATLYFTTTNEFVTGDSRSDVTGMKQGDIWISKRDEHGQWLPPRPPDGDVNTDSDEGCVALSPDGRTMYLTRAYREKDGDELLRIFVSRRQEAAWTEPELFEQLDDSAFNYAHPAVSPDGRFLYFTSDRRGGVGATDIWRLRLDSPQARPQNLGPRINTSGREMFPTVRNDSLLYFSSDGHPGFGGLDIFRARLQKNGTWIVENMSAPLNSSADDFGITFFDDSESGFFSSSRGDARGYDNIYSFILPDLRIRLLGFVTDFDEEPIRGAAVRIVGRDGSNLTAFTKDDGSFELPLERGVDYTMLAAAKGYMNARQEFTSDTAELDADYSVTFMLASLTQPNIVENIFYDFDLATLRPESKDALDALALVLRENPGISIRLGAHADRKGSEAYNLDLSTRRAKAVVDYLVTAGIPAGRLSWKGYGKTEPKRVTKRIAREYPEFEEGALLDEDFILSLPEQLQEIADQINRRTEFEVTGIEKW